jgi:hypothetical protein
MVAGDHAGVELPELPGARAGVVGIVAQIAGSTALIAMPIQPVAGVLVAGVLVAIPWLPRSAV